MPRDSNGTYTLPATAAAAGSVIKSSVINAIFSDIADALTGSLATNGSSSMTGPLKADNGSLAAPSYTFAADTDTGFYLSDTDEMALVVGGELVGTFKSDQTVEWEATHTFSSGINVSGTTSISGTISISTQLDVSGSANFSGPAIFTSVANFQATVSFTSTILVSGGLYINRYLEIQATASATPGSASNSSIRLFVRDRDNIDRLSWTDEDGFISEPAIILLVADSVSAGAATLDIVFTQYPYKNLIVKLADFRPSVDGADLYVRVSDDGGSTYEADASDYSWTLMYLNASTASASGLSILGALADSEIQVTDNQESFNTSTLAGLALELTITGANGSGNGSHFFWTAAHRSGSGSSAFVWAEGGGYADVSDCTAIRFLYNSGTIQKGYYYLYGAS